MTENHVAALALIVARPGQLDADSIGQALWRPKITPSNYLSVRKIIVSEGDTWAARASSILRDLVEAGLVERERPPMVAERWRKLVKKSPLDAILEAVPGDWGDEDSHKVKIGLLAKLSQRPATVAEWLGEKPTGNVGRAVAWLSEHGLVVLPGQRWPTKAGIEAARLAVQKSPPSAEMAAK